MAATDVWKAVKEIGAITKNMAKYLKDSAMSLGNLVSTSSLAAAKDYGGVFKQVNFDLAYRNKLNLIGLKNLQLTNAELGDAVAQTAAYGFDLRMAAETWFDISDAIAKTSYVIGASTQELAKLANYSNLLGGDFKEVAGYLVDIVGKTALTGSEVTDTAAEVSRMNLLFGRGGALTKESLVTISKMADRLKQAGGNAKELVTAISGANARFTSAAGLGFLPGFATDKLGAGLARYNSMLGGFSKMIMSQNALVRGTLADAFGPLFNLSGDALLEFGVNATKELTDVEIQARDVNKVWKEMTQSMGESWDRLWLRLGKAFTAGSKPITDSINSLTEKIGEYFDDNKIGDKIAAWVGSAGTIIINWVDDFVKNFDTRMAEFKGYVNAVLHPLDTLWNAMTGCFTWKNFGGLVLFMAALGIIPALIISASFALGGLSAGAAPLMATLTAGSLGMAAFGVAAAGVGVAAWGIGKAFEGLGKVIEALGGAWSKVIGSLSDGIAKVIKTIDDGKIALNASAVAAAKSFNEIGDEKLTKLGVGLGALAKGMGELHGASGFWKGLFSSLGKTVGELERFATIGNGLRAAGEGVTWLAASLSKMPSKFTFGFDEASFQSARRLRDAVTVIDGGSGALERVVSLFERLDSAIRSISSVKEFRLPSVTEVVAVINRSATTASRTTSSGAPEVTVSSSASPAPEFRLKSLSPVASPPSRTSSEVADLLRQLLKVTEDQAKSEKERADAASESEKNNNNTRAQSGAARTPVTTTR